MRSSAASVPPASCCRSTIICAAIRTRTKPTSARSLPGISAAAPATCRSSRLRSTRLRGCVMREKNNMLDLGSSFLASVARDPQVVAIVDGDVRLTHAAWYRQVSALIEGFDELELEPGGHLVTVLQNRHEAATIHWARQLAGIIVPPGNWRAPADGLRYLLVDA